MIYYSYQFYDSVIDCEFDYEPAETGSREGGVQTTPDYPPVLSLIAAYLNQVDIVELLSEDIIDDMTDDALASI